MEFSDLVFRSFFSFLVTRFCVFDMRNDPSEGICAEQPIVSHLAAMCQCHHIKTHAHPRMLREGQAVAAGFASLPGQPKPWSENIAEIVYSYMMITPNFVQSRLFFNCAFSCVDRFSQMKRSTVRRFLPVRQAPQYPKDAQFGSLGSLRCQKQLSGVLSRFPCCSAVSCCRFGRLINLAHTACTILTDTR